MNNREEDEEVKEKNEIKKEKNAVKKKEGRVEGEVSEHYPYKSE